MRKENLLQIKLSNHEHLEIRLSFLNALQKFDTLFNIYTKKTKTKNLQGV